MVIQKCKYKTEKVRERKKTSIDSSAMKEHCLCAIDHDYFTTVSIVSLSVWSLAPPITDGQKWPFRAF